MPKPLFYASGENIGDKEAILSQAESSHAALDLGLRPGDAVILVDGLGGAYRGSIGKISRKKTVIKVYDRLRNFGEPVTRVTLAVGLLSTGKFKSIVEQSTALGVSRIVPLVTRQTTEKPGDNSRKKSRARSFEKVALSSMKESRRSYCPIISQPINLMDFIRETDPDALNLIFDSQSKAGKLENHINGFKGKRVTILIGPEEGFSPDETKLALSGGFKAINLGQRLLSAETAGIVAVALVMDALGELS